MTLISGHHLRANYERALQYGEQMRAIRTSAANGMRAQVRASKLPLGSLGEMDSVVRQVNAPVCVLLIERKDPLVQVQVRTNTLFVPLADLLPAGKPVRSPLGSSQPSQDWCVQ